jgi:hypothetical protein
LVEVVPGPFLTEPNVDLERWHTDGILDVLMQDSGANSSQLRVLTFDLADGTGNPKASR